MANLGRDGHGVLARARVEVADLGDDGYHLARAVVVLAPSDEVLAELVRTVRVVDIAVPHRPEEGNENVQAKGRLVEACEAVATLT